MREEIKNAGNILNDLISSLEELVETALKKKEIILTDAADSQKLVNIITKERNLTRDFKKVELSLAATFKEIGTIFDVEGMNLSGLINRLVDFPEEKNIFIEKKEKIDSLLDSFVELNNINTSLLNTNANYYRYLFKKLNKSNTYRRENKKQKINLVSTTA
ncbi:MAG: hypothetical protein C0601_03885 [Candidatus Muiribacterium halophilum]|uniref:Flagellar protein FlgN n=1 Tax=Muiribacterium halophilum TaxID=2053465 RepID=A0A2N5ZJB6_MUIH1|nr:MAG: hypothetical protein C0601_03885 [Candidatus Muirbacterium halophilum]